MKREEHKKDIWREDCGWDKMGLAQIYNGIKYMFYFYVLKRETRNKKFYQLILEKVY